MLSGLQTVCTVSMQFGRVSCLHKNSFKASHSLRKCVVLSDNFNFKCLFKTLFTASNNGSTEKATPSLTKNTAKSLVMKLTEEERSILLSSLNEFEAEQRKEEYKGQLAAFRWRSKFGRPSKVPRLGDVDPTGSYCPVPEDWLLRKYGKLAGSLTVATLISYPFVKPVRTFENVCDSETVPKPTTPQLLGVAIHNSIPFIGFGFLDNFVMILCGDYIDYTLGSMVVMSTMAAAALGNTFSDVLGIGSAWYVERIAAKVGVKPPSLSPIQLDMFSSRLASNLGRVFGVTIGCLLGMVPLFFINPKENDKKSEE